jgi:hypothetical protein
LALLISTRGWRGFMHSNNEADEHAPLCGRN